MKTVRTPYGERRADDSKVVKIVNEIGGSAEYVNLHEKRNNTP
jgi:hypothetical protein